MKIENSTIQQILSKFISGNISPVVQADGKLFIGFDSITLTVKDGIPTFILIWNEKPISEVPIANITLPKSHDLNLTLTNIIAFIPTETSR